MNRLFLKIGLLMVILALCLYSHFEYSRRHSTIPDIKEDPERYENVSFRSEGRVENVRYDEAGTRFTLIVMGDEIEALYPRRASLKEGDYVIAFGILRMREGFLGVTKLHVYKDIRRLYVLSVVGLLLVIYLFLRDWSFSRNFEWRWRNA